MYTNMSLYCQQNITMLNWADIGAFVDLDDTLTTYDTLLYSKIKFLTKYMRYWFSEARDIVAPWIKINESTITLIQDNWFKNLYILSKNTQRVVDAFIKMYNEQWFSHIIIGWRGHLTSNEKIVFTWWNKPLISDLLERKSLCHYPLFICTENYNILRYYQLIGKKVILFLYFVCCVLWKKLLSIPIKIQIF